MIDFKQRVVDASASEYERVSLPPQYRQLLESIAAIMQPFLGMSELAVRGFISQSIAEWQVRHKKEIGTVLTLSLEERQRFMKEGMDILYHILSEKVLKKSEDQPKLKKAVDAGLKAYYEKFMPKTK